MKKSKSIIESAPVPGVIYLPYIWHYFHEEGMSRYRVWRNDWFSDQFELLSVDEFSVLQNLSTKLGISLQSQEDC